MEKVKLFSPKEASQTLPLVKKIVGDILSVGQKIRMLSEELGKKAEKDTRVTALMDQLEELIEELENIGCLYRDWNFTVGLVDFPAMIEGEEVSLCWRSDEENLRFYHGLEEGFAGRKAIPEKYLA